MLRLGRSEPLQLPLILPPLKKRAKGLILRPRMEKLPAKVTHDRGSVWGWMRATGDGDGKGFRKRLGVVRLGRGGQGSLGVEETMEGATPALTVSLNSLPFK